MSKAPDNHELARQLTELRGKMNTTSAKLEGEMTTLKSDLKATLEGLRKDQERYRAEMHAERVVSQRWMFGMVTAAVAIVIATIAGFNLYGGGPPAAP